MNKRWSKWGRKIWREWIKPFLVVVLVLCTFRSAVADWNDVPSGSMKPTLLEGDRIFVNKLAYDLKFPFTRFRLARWGEPEPGDVVIVFSPADGTRLVKRVIGTPGDTVAMANNRLIVNGRPLEYAPTDPEAARYIEIGSRGPHQFASEAIGAHEHPIMMMPFVRTRRSFELLTVPSGKYFVMGDNRDASRDSRAFGFADRDDIVGSVPAVVLSLNPDRYYLPRLDRFFKSIP